MKLRFESNQEYQLEAIRSVVDIFEGQPLSTGQYNFRFSRQTQVLRFQNTALGMQSD